MQSLYFPSGGQLALTTENILTHPSAAEGRPSTGAEG